MALFNSLGSNYDFRFVLQSLFSSNDERYLEQLKNFLGKKYGGEAILLYKGREALRLALKIIDKKDAVVGICGYTCYAVYEPIISEGYAVEYLDIEENTLHFSYKTLQEKLHNNPKIKILIIQNTLGYPTEVDKIKKLCHEKKIILIEDLAHSIGATYADGLEAGTVGDFVIFSFSQDKLIDGISGGALILRNKNFKFLISNFQLKYVNTRKQLLDRLYPVFTYAIRKTYASGVGRLLHVILKKLHLLVQPMDQLESALHQLPAWNANIIYQQFRILEKNILHRRKIAEIYNSHLNKIFLLSQIGALINASSNIRFPIFYDKRNDLIFTLKKKNIFISDIWFDAPIAPKKYLHLTNYSHQCHHAENIADKILNLPTHKNTTVEDAKYISQLINSCLI